MFEKSAGRQFNFLTQMQLQTVKIVQADALSHRLPALAMVAPLVAGLTAMERQRKGGRSDGFSRNAF